MLVFGLYFALGAVFILITVTVTILLFIAILLCVRSAGDFYLTIISRSNHWAIIDYLFFWFFFYWLFLNNSRFNIWALFLVFCEACLFAKKFTEILEAIAGAFFALSGVRRDFLLTEVSLRGRDKGVGWFFFWLRTAFTSGATRV